MKKSTKKYHLRKEVKEFLFGFLIATVIIAGCSIVAYSEYRSNEYLYERDNCR